VSPKRRIDQLLVDRGLASSRHKAQALVMAGQVLAGGQKVAKPGQRIDADAELRLLGGARFASRAGEKLEAALEHFGISVEGRLVADLGASTGGFTDCLLQRGARRVVAFDVGAGQLDWRLRTDPCVTVRDDFNVRFLTAADLPPGVSVVTVDLSFISLTKVLEPLRDALRGAGSRSVELVLLVKPQFEVGRGRVGRGGIVRNEAARADALANVVRFAEAAGYGIAGSIDSPIAGAAGNREFLLYLRLDADL